MKTSIATAAVCLSFGIALTAQQTHHGQQTTHDDHGRRHMEHRFDDPERYAASFDDPERDAWQMPGRVIETLDIRPGQLVADVGAGTGYFTVRLSRGTEAAKVYAIDIEPTMVDWIRDRAEGEGLDNVVAVLAGSDRTNLPEPVDVVLVVDTYHHIPERVDYFTRLRQELEPSGRLAIVDFRKDSPSGPPVEFRFTPEEISSELAQAGFTLLEQHGFLPRQMFLVYESN